MTIVNQNYMPFFDMKNANDLYQKLKHDFELLKEKPPNIYNYMDFIFTANHLNEWIKKDVDFDIYKKEEAKKIFNYKVNQEYSTIKSLCNKSKHFFLDKSEYEKEKYKSLGFELNNIDFSNFTFNGLEYFVKVGNNIIELYKVCNKVFEDYNKVFKDIEKL